MKGKHGLVMQAISSRTHRRGSEPQIYITFFATHIQVRFDDSGDITNRYVTCTVRSSTWSSPTSM